MGLCGNLFQSLEFRINDKTISRVSDFVPQIDALENRMSKSKSWMDSIGATVNFWNSDYTKRLSDVTADASTATPTEQVVDYEQLGYIPTNTLSIAVDTGVLTFAAGGPGLLPDARNVFAAGEETFSLFLHQVCCKNWKGTEVSGSGPGGGGRQLQRRGLG